ncbi:MAG: pyridoxal phosphate-dependent aminotransferase [Synergistaceae bacterium]|nr:pyridoxal phosphate-dependent aminotransferase [Synergistaceae bacterium]
MDYDFDKIINRRGTNSSKWDRDPGTIEGADYPVGDGLLPLWVADMDFEVAPEIKEALIRRAEHGVYGYTLVPDSCYDAILSWLERRHNWHVEREWIRFVPGAVMAGHLVVQALCQPGDKVILQTPIYYPFFRTAYNNGTQLSLSPLKLKEDRYEMDFEDFERRAADPRASLFFLCNPHNPVGRVWTHKELTLIGEICRKHHVRVFSDELHCDIVMPGNKHVPFASLGTHFSNNSITAVAPSKTFNLAGLQATVVIVPDSELRQRFDNVLSRNSVSNPNLFAITAMEAGYARGEKWVDAMCAYIKGNYDFLVRAMAKALPKAKVMPMEGTYLAWLDFRAVEPDAKRLQKRMLTEAKVWLDEGWLFGAEGRGFERLVLACPRSVVQEAVERMAAAFAG